MTVDFADVRALGELFSGHSDERVRVLGIEALRQWSVHQRAQNRPTTTFSLHGELALHLLPLLFAERPTFKGDHAKLKEAFLFSPNQWDEPMALLAFLQWLHRAGIAFPLGAAPNQYPSTYRLTARGVALLETTDDHPLLPGHIERLRQRCPGLPDDVVALLSDSDACLDQGLLRPAVAVMGVAYEVAVEAVITALVGRATLPATVQDQNAARRISAVRAVVDTIFVGRTPPEIDRRFAAYAAYDFADALRRRRNDASHTAPRYGFGDQPEVEELLVSACRHLPALWSAFMP